MALKDSSGRITIDEVAAQQDIRKLEQAMDVLSESQKALESLLNQAGSEQGQTARAIEEKAAELKRQVVSLKDNLNVTSQFIRQTVAHYQEVDRQLKAAILAQQVTAVAQASVPTPSAPKAQASVPKQTKPKAKASVPSFAEQVTTKPKKPADIKETLGDILDDVGDWFKSFGK